MSQKDPGSARSDGQPAAPSGSRPVGEDLFARADWYDRSINWPARLRREIPVLTELFGPPGKGGILDAGCGTGRQACALAQRGYRVCGADSSEQMLEIARRNAQDASLQIRFELAAYSDLSKHWQSHQQADLVGGGFDGLYCLGNSLAAAGTRAAVHDAVTQFGQCLKLGGRLFIQILNFSLMRTEEPCVRGPRIATLDGVEYVSVRQFHFVEDLVNVTNITLFNDSGWKYRTHTGVLYPVGIDELRAWCASAGLRVDDLWGDYRREPFDAEQSADLLLTATRV